MIIKQHFHAIAGLHGCMPNYCETFESYTDAVDSLAQVHELGKNRTRELKNNEYLELNLRRDGNEYCEITSCSDNDCQLEEPFTD
jgi:hypothetical protein